MALKPVSAVYIIEHPSGAFYIGATTDLAMRWRGHRTRLRAGTHRSALQSLVTAGDISCFTVRPLLIASRDNLPIYEARALATYSQCPGFANLTTVARMTFPTAATKHRIALANKGQLKSEITRQRMSEAKRTAFANGTWEPASKGTLMSAEQKAKISNTRKALFAQGKLVAASKGKPMSAEQKRKLSEARFAWHAHRKSVGG
jgi:hypothetical protein